MIKIKIMNPEIHAFRELKAASVQKFYHQVVWIIKVPDHAFDFIPGQNHRNTQPAVCPYNPVNFPKFFFQDMPEKKQKSVECLILGGCRNLFFNHQAG